MRRSRERDALTRWIEHAGGVDAAIAAALAHARRRSDGHRRSRRGGVLRRSRSSRRRNGRRSRRILARGSESDRKQQGLACRSAQASIGRERVDTYLAIFCTTTSRHARKSIVTRAIANDSSRAGWSACRPSRSASARCSSAGTPSSVAIAAPRCITIADAVIARYRAEKANRSLLDYDDLIDHTLALFGNVSAGLGALQARPRHRPCADRRSAGHEPEAMGRHQPRSSASSSPGPARAARSSARCSRWATRSSRSFRSRAPCRSSSRRCAGTSNALHRRQRARVHLPRVQALLPLRRRTSSAPSTRCFASRSRCRERHRATPMASRRTSRCRTRRPAWSSSGR